jgi:hypothetical protein
VIGDLGWAHDAGVEWRRTMRSPTVAWRDDASAGCPTMLTMAADRKESRGPGRFKSQPRYFPVGRAPKPARRFWRLAPCQTDYRAIPLMPRAERRAFHRAKDMNWDDTGAPLRAPAQAPQASPPRI